MKPVVVVGAGPAGCAAAIALARAGRAVTLLERSAAPAESVCGEFLGGDAVALLRGLGLEPAALGAVRLTGVAVGAGRHQAAAPLPFEAYGLSRRVLDGALQWHAERAGVCLRRGVTAAGASPTPNGWVVNGLPAECVVLATGKHNLRGHARWPIGRAVGLKLHLEGLDLPPAVHVLRFAGGYAGLQPGPGGVANLCAALEAQETRLLDRIREGSSLAERLLRGARPVWQRPLAVAGVPYGFRQSGGLPGLYRVGDQLSVIPSFAGDGMAMALASGLAAARAILAGQDSAAFHAQWRRRSARPMRLAGAGAWLMRHLPLGFVAALGSPLAAPLMHATRIRPAAPHSSATASS